MTEIRYVAVHDLLKKDNVFEVVLGKDQINIGATAKRLVDALYDLYNRRTSKSHGRFADDQDNYPVQKFLHDYVEGGFGGFPEFTAQLMSTLRKEAGNKAAATGGHVFFAHFKKDAKEYLLVVIMNDKLGAALTNDLDVEDVKHLDIEGFRFAGRINITGWKAGEERYISFMKGKGNVAEYFREFLGCSLDQLEKRDTQDLVAALKEYADSNVAFDQKDAFLKQAKSICERYARSRTELHFEYLANELVPDAPEKLLDVLTDADRALNDMFVPNVRALNPLVKFEAKTDLWSLEFAREALNKDFHYDPEENTLLIKNVPESLAKELKEEIPH